MVARAVRTARTALKDDRAKARTAAGMVPRGPACGNKPGLQSPQKVECSKGHGGRKPRAMEGVGTEAHEGRGGDGGGWWGPVGTVEKVVRVSSMWGCQDDAPRTCVRRKPGLQSPQKVECSKGHGGRKPRVMECVGTETREGRGGGREGEGWWGPVETVEKVVHVSSAHLCGLFALIAVRKSVVNRVRETVYCAPILYPMRSLTSRPRPSKILNECFDEDAGGLVLDRSMVRRLDDYIEPFN